MRTLTTEELMTVVNEMEAHNMVGETQVYVSGTKAVKAHAHVMTMHTEEEGYSHLMTMHTMTREVLAHELAHMHLHVIGRYNQEEQHGEEHTSVTEAMMNLIEQIL